MPLSSGQTIVSRYRVIRILGQGGYGAVYLVEDTRLSGRVVALKESFDNSRAAAQQFQFEAETLAKLRHPALVSVTDLFESGGHHFFVMDYVEGNDLSDLIVRGAVTEQQAIHWMLEVSDAVAFLHAQNPPIIHRDIKPQNIKIRMDGHAILVDFGIAKAYVPTKQTVQAARAISSGYSPPEQYGSGTDARSDVYSLGATLYCALTARVPPEAMDILSGSAQLVRPCVTNPRLSPTLENIVLQAMSLNSQSRYPTARELSQALQAYVRGGAVGPASPVQPVPPQTPAAQGVRCPVCSHVNRVGAKFCQRDRTLLGSVAPRLPAAPAIPAVTPQMHFEMGNAFARKKDYVRAVKEYSEAQRGGFEHVALYNNWANVCVEMDKAADAIQILQTGIGRYPGDADLYGQLGFAYAVNGQNAQAIQVLQRALSLNPTPDTHFLLGLVYQKLKDYANASSAFREFLDSDDSSLLGHLWLARCLLLSDQFTDAQAEAQRVIQLDPQHEEAHLISAIAHWRNNRYNDAVKAAQQCNRIQPTAAAFRVMGQAYMELKKWNDAAKAFGEANRLDSQNAETHLYLALCYLKLNRRSEARREFKEVLAIDPTVQVARDALKQV